MLIQEKHHDAFKRWVLPKLETISDADAEVLADYVLALVTGQDSEANVRQKCLESLADFLHDNTESFVSDVVKALREKRYLQAATTKAKANGTRSQTATTGIEQASSHHAPIPSIVGTSNSEYQPHSLHSANSPPVGAPTGPAATRVPGRSQAHNIQSYVPSSSRKRKLVERESDQSKGGDTQQDRGGSHKKLMRQTARRTAAQARVQDGVPHNGFAPFSPAMANLHNFPTPPPPPPRPPFHPSDLMTLLSRAGTLGFGMSEMPTLPFSTSQFTAQSHVGPKDKCRDFYTQGFCVLGSVCPYEHDNAVAVPSIPEYDPEHASLALHPNGQADSGKIGHGAPRGRLQANRGPHGRADITHFGPSHDPANTTLVVDKIPLENCSEDEVRGFFSAFGQITDVKMHAYKRMAIINFQDRESAQRAYGSPKAVFDNRFVRVFWHRTRVDSPWENDDADTEYVGQEEERESAEEIAKRQAEAQKAFEERRRKAEETEARSAEVGRQLKEKTEEMRKIRQQLAELSGEKDGEEEGFAQTLASLQAEAEDLFAQYEPNATPPIRGRDAYRGSYRGRGYATVPPRGRGYAASFRGAYRGRGGAGFQTRTSVKRLDNRPRRLAVANVEEHSAKDEALRQHLINVPDCTSIERHPEQPTSLILSFKERYQAEMFLDESRTLSDVGKLDFSWVPNDAFGGLKTTTIETEDADVSDGESSATVGEDDAKPAIDSIVKAEQDDDKDDADMDVADDVDQWL